MSSHEGTGIKQFSGCDFGDWKFRIECLLEEKSLKDTISRAPTQEELANEEYKKRQLRAKNMIVKHVAPSHIQFIKGKDTVYLMWKNLTDTFEPKSLGKRVILKRRLNTIKCDPNESLDEFLRKYDALLDEFRAAGGTVDDDELLTSLLSTLPDKYDNIATVLENMENCTYDKAKTLLLEREMKFREKTETSDVLNVAFNARKNIKKKPSQKGRKKIGVCWTCSKPGHKSPDCPTKKSSGTESNFSNSFAFMAGDMPVRKVTFLIDSGASEHMIADRSLLSVANKLTNAIKIQVAKEQESITAEYSGMIHLSQEINEGERTHISLSNVLVVKGLRHNLLSVRQIESRGGSFTFANGKVVIKVGDRVVAMGHCVQKLYVVEFVLVDSETANIACKCDHDMSELWHRRLGHMGLENVKKLINSDMASGTRDKIASNIPFCETCVRSKGTRQPYSGERPKTSRPLERIHSDVCGPMPVNGHDGSRYFVTFTDDYTHLTVTYLMKQKSETVNKFKEYFKMATSHFNTKVARLRSDRGTEYTCTEMKDFCKENGIVNPAHNPQLNGVAERLNRTLVEKARAMLLDGSVPDNLWTEAIMTSTYLGNRSPTITLKNMTPFEAWFGRKPDISNLRVFGSKSYAHEDGQLKKLDCRSTKPLIMVGYDHGGYRLWDNVNRKLVVRRNVIFNEKESSVILDPPNEKSGESINTLLIKNSPLSTPVNQKSTVSPLTPKTLKYVAKSTQQEDESEDDEFHGFTDNDEDEHESPKTIRKPVKTVIRRNPTRTCRSNLNPRKLDMHDSHVALSAVNYIEETPLTYSDVFGKDDEQEWLKAIDSELNSLNENNTWELVPDPGKVKMLDTKWVFKVKDDVDGPKYKARLVVRGYQQKKGIDYHDTYSPVARLPTIRLIIALSAKYKLSLRHLDVTTAFLYGNLEETVYLKDPEGVEVPKGHTIKLKRSLYGLKQSSKCWNVRFHDYISSIGMIRSQSDYCLYVRKEIDSILLLVLYVDDVLLAASDESIMDDVISKLGKEFKMKDLGQPKRFMGLDIDIESDRITINQKRFVNKILEKFEMQDSKPVKTPIEVNLNLIKGGEGNTDIPYRELVGSLTYLANATRPDICFATSYLSRFQEGATHHHYCHLKRILRYLNGTVDNKLIYQPKDESQPITAFVDSDFANDLEDRKSTTGYVIFCFDCPILWGTKKQPIVTLSSTEAEYVAANLAACEVLWLRKIFKEISIDLPDPTLMFEDNQGAIMISQNAETKRTKHMPVRYNFLRECVANKEIQMRYVPTDQQLADALTKGLTRDKFEVLTSRIMRGSVNWD